MTRALRATAAALLGALCLAVSATAVVPPKSCGTMTVKGKRYQIKADQISCTTAREHSRRYLQYGRRPSGYRCDDKPSRVGRMDFYCNDGRKVFFAIRR